MHVPQHLSGCVCTKLLGIEPLVRFGLFSRVSRFDPVLLPASRWGGKGDGLKVGLVGLDERRLITGEGGKLLEECQLTQASHYNAADLWAFTGDEAASRGKAFALFIVVAVLDV